MREATSVISVDYEKTLKLRQQVLRPHQTVEQCIYPGDENAAHFACEDQAKIIAILSIYPEDERSDYSSDYWRIRGLATQEGYRNQGLASALINTAEAHVRSQGGRVVWCNARVSASTFYLQRRYNVYGDVFDIPGIGDHLRMIKNLIPEPMP